VERIDGGYEDAVAHAAALGGEALGGGATTRGGATTGAGGAPSAAGDVVVVSDTSWPGYTEIPARVVEGYATMFAEIDVEPDLVVVPIGVGSLAAAAARHYRPGSAFLLGLEPVDAACALESARAGHPIELTGPMRSTMAGLNCATPSPAAWPLLASAFDAFCSIDDTHVDWGMRRLAALGIDRGACTGGALGGLRAHRDALALAGDATVVVIGTEGVTDPVVFQAAVGRPPNVNGGG
jgi:diaminopropionate ammonia-lyase